MKVRWAATALLVAAAIVGGFLLSKTVTSGLRGDESESAAPRSSDARRAPLGRLRVEPDAGWTQLDRAPAVPGFVTDRSLGFSPYPGLKTVAIATLRPADDATLLPEELREDAPRPSTRRLAGIPAWFYRGLTSGRWRLDAAVLPTSQGVITVACAVPSGAGEPPVDCLNGVRGIFVTDATPLPPSASVAFQTELPRAVIELNTARVGDRTAIRRAKTPAGQARAAARLRAAHRRAVGRLAPLAADAQGGATLVRALNTTADAYAALERAAKRRDKRQWTRARARTRRAESALATALARAREQDGGATAKRDER